MVSHKITARNHWFRGQIARYLAVSFTAFAAFVIVIVITTIYMVRSIRIEYENALARTDLSLLGVQIRAESLELTNLAQRYTSAGTDASTRQDLRSALLARREVLEVLANRAVEKTTNDDLIERAQLADIQERVSDLYLQSNRLIEAFDEEQGFGPDTQNSMKDLIREYEVPLTQAIDEFQTYEAARFVEAQQEVQRSFQITLGILFFVAFLAIVFTGSMVYWSFRSIVFPLVELNSGVEQLRHGRLDYPIQVKSKDEIGILAETLGSMATQLQQTLSGLEHNLTELRQTQAALKTSEEHYRSLFDGVPLGLFQTTPDGRILDANPALFQMLGYPNHEALLAANALDTYIDRSDRQRWQELMEAYGKVLHFECRIRRHDNTMFWGRRSSRLVRDEQGNMFYEGSLEDITEIKEAEQAVRAMNAELERRVHERTAQLEAANKELEAFSYSVSHDLRAPLRALIGYSHLLNEEYTGVLDDTGKEYLNNLSAASQRMNELIDDLLKLSRITRGEMHCTWVDLSALAEVVAASLRRLAPERQVQFIISRDVKAYVDPNLVRIVLENLMGNAWKFTARHARARIEFGMMQMKNEQDVYFVRDDGAGFDMAYADKIFDVFQRYHSIDEFEGSGIGLATVQRIIQRHGGRIWAESAVEGGAVFYFTLPVKGSPINTFGSG